MFSRRSFLARSSATALLSLFPRSGRAYTRHVGDLHEFPLGERHALIAQRADPKQVHTLVMRALDAARNAGAQYADVRLTRTVRQHYRVIGNSTLWHTYPRRAGWGVGEHDYAPTDKESLGVGVRAFVDGCWGFAASPFWDLEEMPILAQEAVQQASANAKVTPRQLTLAPTPVVTGSWHPPEVIDPFSISHEEKIEYLRNAFDYISQRIGPIQRGREDILNAWSELKFTRQEWVLGTSEGTYCTQERYITEPEFGFAHNHSSVAPGGWGFGFGSLHAKYPRMVAQGWEVCNATTARERIDAAIETFYNPKTPTPPPRSRPVEVGRYDIVCSANIAVQLIQNTFAQATELDRILGYEANASGTSYIQDPLSAIGTLQLGSPQLTVTANRSAPGQLATVKWDDEGVEPEDFTLVSEGILSDLQTTREGASWLAPYYNRIGQPIRSHGCAAADSALSITMSHPPNLAMRPSTEEVSFEDLIKDTSRGLAFLGSSVGMSDFQNETGVIGGNVREIRNGKLGDVIENAGMLFESSKLWNSLVAIGGGKSQEVHVAVSRKGQPEQTTYYNVSAVPFKLRDVAIIDVTRRG